MKLNGMSLFRKKKKYKIDASLFTDRESAHRTMQEVFSGCEYYGSNLDALHDVLTTIMIDSTVLISHFGAAREALGEYADIMERVFRDSAAENRHLEVIFLPEEDK